MKLPTIKKMSMTVNGTIKVLLHTSSCSTSNKEYIRQYMVTNNVLVNIST